MRRWVQDSESEFCSNCHEAFTLLNRKHHCRVCGRLLCHSCCQQWLLIPPQMLIAPSTTSPHGPGPLLPPSQPVSSTPQRCCDTCARNLTGLQSDLRQQNAKSNAPLKIDRNGHERYLNVPVSRKMETDIRKATYTLYNFTGDNKIEGRDVIPRELMQGAKGLAFITVLKAGFLFSGRIGTGLVIARLSDGSWSAPSAIAMSGLGWGFQMGGELTDVLLVLTTEGAVQAFSSNAQIAVGTELSVSLGPVGRSAGTDVHGGKKGASAAFSYAHSKGLFAGVSLEASVIAARHDVNRQFYGMEVTPAQLLSGEIPGPKAAEPLYQALTEVLREDGEFGVSDRAGYISRVYLPDDDYNNDTPQPGRDYAVPAAPVQSQGRSAEDVEALRRENMWLREQRTKLQNQYESMQHHPSSSHHAPSSFMNTSSSHLSSSSILERDLNKSLGLQDFEEGDGQGGWNSSTMSSTSNFNFGIDDSLMSVALTQSRSPESAVRTPPPPPVQTTTALQLLDELLQADRVERERAGAGTGTVTGTGSLI